MSHSIVRLIQCNATHKLARAGQEHAVCSHPRNALRHREWINGQNVKLFFFREPST